MQVFGSLKPAVIRSLHTSHTNPDDETTNNRKWRLLKGADILGIRYCYPLVHVNGSDPCAVRIIEINLSVRMKIAWRRGRANVNRLLGNPPPEPRIAHESACCLPYEIVETIIAHIACDLDALKACSLTCHSWYIAVVPHFHHTLILKSDLSGTAHDKLKPLSELHQLGLALLIKEIRVEKGTWFEPQAFSRRDLCYFSAFTNVRTLRLQYLDISRFIPGIERYFGHFSPALRSITLFKPLCTPRQLSHFLSFFSTLDDIKICGPIYIPNNTIPDAELVSSPQRLRGRLVLCSFGSVETWTHLIISGGALQFHYMDLYRVRGCAPVLFEACAETLESLRFYATDGPTSK
jgi:hypothetical protein